MACYFKFTLIKCSIVYLERLLINDGIYKIWKMFQSFK